MCWEQSNIYTQKIKEEILGRVMQLVQEKTSLYLYKQNMNIKIHLKVLEKDIEGMMKLRDISRNVLFLQINNAK